MRHSMSLKWFLLKSPLALLLIPSLLLVPVECSIAAGPHSLFTDASDLAAVQASHPIVDDVHQRHGQRESPQAEGRATSAVIRTDGSCAMPVPPPSTADIASGSFLVLALPATTARLAQAGPALPLLDAIQAPPDRLLFAPEPPPP